MKKFGTIFIVLLIIFFSYEGFVYLKYRSDNAVSDAAFIKSDSLSVLSFKVSGKIVKLNKIEGSKIKKGEILAKIDDKDYLVAQNKIKNSIMALEKSKEALEVKLARTIKELDLNQQVAQNNIDSYKQRIKSLQLAINASQTKFQKLALDEKRYAKMLKQKLISKNSYEKVATAKKSLQDAILSQKKELDSVVLNLKNIKNALKLSIIKKSASKELEKQIESLDAKKKALLDDLQTVKNKISYCTLKAPFDGVVAKKIANANQVVKAGYPIFYVLNPKDLHVEVLLSEKKLHGVKIGNKVKLKIDALSDQEYNGKVSDILPTSASTFSLVPRDIASGEFTKLDQRFTVRISLDEVKNLMVGMSVNIAIQRTK